MGFDYETSACQIRAPFVQRVALLIQNCNTGIGVKAPADLSLHLETKSR